MGTLSPSVWDGYYFPGMRVHLSVADAQRFRLASWRINGRDVSGPNAEVVAEQDLAIEPIWRAEGPARRETPPPTQ